MNYKYVSKILATAASGALVLLANVSVGADYQTTVLSDSPAGYWRLGEMPNTLGDIPVINSGSLGATADGVYGGYVGRQEDGALAGSADKANRFWGNIAEVSRVTLGSASSFNFTGNGVAMPFTLEVWAKPMSAPSGSQRMIANGSAGQGYGFSLQGNNTLRLTAFGVADVTSDVYAPAFVSNTWYHLVFVRSNVSAYFFVNGVQLGARKTLNNIVTTANPLTLGRTAAGAEPFTGVLDEPAVYSTNLAAAQILAHYQAGTNNGAGYNSVILADNPIGYWRLNEPAKIESTSVVANSGAAGSAGTGAVFGSLNSIAGGLPTPLVAEANSAMNFPGPDGRIDVPWNAALNTPSYTVECWAKMDSWANVHLSPVTSRQSGVGGTRGFILYAAPATVTGLYTNRPRWEFWSGTSTAFNAVNGGGADVETNKWTHLVGTYDAASKVMALYVDGALARGLINVTHAPNLLTPLRIGAGSSELTFGQYHWRGGLDEVAVYPTALSPQRVQAHYEAALGVSPGVTAAPGVLVQPQGQTNWAPYPVTVSCVVTGSLPMQFQWFNVSPDGLATNTVPNATNMVLVLDPTNPAQNGNYYLAATNALGGTETAWAYVEITPLTAPAFAINAPATVPVYAGGTSGIPAIAVGTPPMNYQWQSNSVNIAGATNSILALPNVQAPYASATFQSKASNPVSTTTSDPAQLNVLTPPASTYAAVATSLGPLAYWRLGETTGILAFDYWGGHPAFYSNVLQGAASGALSQDDDGGVVVMGAGSFVRTLEVQPFNFTGTQPFTLAAWVNVNQFPTSNGRARLFSNRWLVGGTGGYGLAFLNNNTLRFTGFGVADADASVSSFTAGQWYHVAAVRSNTTVYLYINGVLANSGTVNNINPTIYPLQLGGNPNFASATDGESLDGSVDDAAVFNRALSSSEISALYTARYGSLLPPSITKAPTPAVVYAGGTARFQVEAAGSQPLTYQWKTNGIAINGATSPSLVLAGVPLGLNGVNCTVTIANQAGSITSPNALITVQQPAGYTAAVVADNPVALWRLGESAGPVVYDSWGGYNGSDNFAVAYNSPGALANDANTAVSFAGLGKLDVPYAPALNTTVYSVECWARVTGGEGTYRCVVNTRDEIVGGYQKGFIIYATVDNIWSFWTSFSGAGAGWQILNGPAVVLNEWTHLAAVYDGSSKYFYVNGALVGTAEISAVPNNIRPLRIGAGRPESDVGDYFFIGDIDEVAVYNKVLPSDRIEYHYGLGKYSDDTAPFITQQPVATTVQVGSPATLTARAGGSPLLRSQWLKDGAPIPQATNATLTLTPATYGDNGMYALRAANSIGTVDSAPAKLAVLPPPAFAFVTNDLVLHLKFDNDYLDVSGRGNHATAINFPSFVPGVVGANALRYNTDITGGQYNYATLGTPPDLQFSSNVNFSVSYWVRFTGTPGDLPFLCNAVASYGGFGFTFAPSYAAGGWSWSLGNGAGFVGVYGAANSINNGNWHHLLHTFDRTGSVATAVTC